MQILEYKFQVHPYCYRGTKFQNTNSKFLFWYGAVVFQDIFENIYAHFEPVFCGV